jgi:hypothetical protein
MRLIKQCTLHAPTAFRPSVCHTNNSNSKPILSTEMLQKPTCIQTVRRSNPRLAADSTNFVILYSFVSDLVHRFKSTLNSGSAATIGYSIFCTECCYHWVQYLLYRVLLPLGTVLLYRLLLPLGTVSSVPSAATIGYFIFCTECCYHWVEYLLHWVLLPLGTVSSVLSTATIGYSIFCTECCYHWVQYLLYSDMLSKNIKNKNQKY